MTDSHGIEFEGTRFWVIHRRQKYGPFETICLTDECCVCDINRDGLCVVQRVPRVPGRGAI